MGQLKLTNEDKTRKLADKARRALVNSACKNWDSAWTAAQKSFVLEILAHNQARLCGLKLIEASGHEQADFDFLRANQDKLPKTMSMRALRFCIHLAKNYDQPFKTIEEARATQTTFAQIFGQFEPPARVAQKSHEENPWNDFVTMTSSYTSLFNKLETQNMDSWDKPKLATFLRETEPIVRQYERARDIINLK
jgi:hypothetical protein